MTRWMFPFQKGEAWRYQRNRGPKQGRSRQDKYQTPQVHFLHLGFIVVSSGLHQSFTFKASFTAHWRAPFRDSDPSIYCLDLSSFLNPCQVLLYPLTLACSCLKNQCHVGNANFSGAKPVPLNQNCSGLWVSDWMNLGKCFPRRPYWNRMSRRFSCSIVLFKEVFQNSFALLYHATFHR